MVGAGIAGPAVALWLQRIGWEVTIVEARPPTGGAEGAFLGIAPNGMNAIAPLGIAERLLARGHACARFLFLNGSGRALGSIEREGDRASFGWPLAMIRRADVHAVLDEAVRERGLVVHHGRRLVSIDDDGTRVIAGFEDGPTIEADVLIGADGGRSTTRRLVMPDAPSPLPSGLLDFGGFARVPDVPLASGENVMVFGRRAFFGAFVCPDGETWWFHNGPPTDEALSIDAHRARLLALHDGDPPWVGALIRETPRLLGPWPIHELAGMPRWSKGRVCLVGDAAHLMAPSAGQGASLAFEDALVLSQCLRDLVEPAQAFARFEQLRRARVDAIFREARKRSSNKAPSAFGAWLRDLFLPLVLPAAGRAQTDLYAHRETWERTITST